MTKDDSIISITYYIHLSLSASTQIYIQTIPRSATLFFRLELTSMGDNLFMHIILIINQNVIYVQNET